jgi:hypothetical protein
MEVHCQLVDYALVAQMIVFPTAQENGIVILGVVQNNIVMDGYPCQPTVNAVQLWHRLLPHVQMVAHQMPVATVQQMLPYVQMGACQMPVATVQRKPLLIPAQMAALCRQMVCVHVFQIL